ncbi:CaiB/BaiF CoA transferase family protein [Methylobacterium dankookense]|uniref:Acetyl-CoA:oxalate CoA-transferase n=1 Tax=Methylobacterium dankookense TaxID=560405 RepID=A0ABQ4RRG2_9HYPH|nr:CaiB/BaiF CoA-transferase family protein [Methylobacterium dankookense]GJD59831.1 Acetyl-CoA:oxalate CoA-transferase [Methylobacterium dankookense]
MTAPAGTDLPLEGVRVLDLSRVLAGPWCAQVLGDLGAEVIKVEHPERGDDTRDWGVPTGEGGTTYFDSVNRNKRSLGLDLASEEGAAIARELAARSDVLVQNFKRGGADRLGLGYDRLSAENPRLIYCSVAGYVGDGPEAERPGYDLVVQGESGLMAINGRAEDPPLKFGVAAVDLFTGQYAAQAVLAALYARARTGRGRHVEMALYDSGLSLTSYVGLGALALGHDPARVGNAHPAIVPYGVFEAADGPLVITVGNNAQYRRFCAVIGRPELAENPDYATNLGRSRLRDTLGPLIEAELARRPRAQLIADLQAAGIPCGEVAGLHEALRSPRTAEAGMLHDGPAPVLAPPYRLDGARPPVRRTPPRLGADTAEILAEMGFDGVRVAQLRERGVVA